MTRLSRSFRFPANSSYLAKRRLLEAAGWVCCADMPHNHHYTAAQLLQGLCAGAGVPFTAYRLSRVFCVDEETALEMMGHSPHFRRVYGEIGASRWGRAHTFNECVNFAEQIAPLRIPTPKQLWLLYGVICENWPRGQAADLMAAYIRAVLLAQRERLASTRWTKHDMFEEDYLAIAALILRNGVVAANYNLPMVRAPVQVLNGTYFFIEERPFPPLKDFLSWLDAGMRNGYELSLQPDVLEIFSTHM